MPPGSPTGWRVSDGLPFGSRIVCRCMHVPRVCVGPSADRCLGSRLRLCVTPPSTRYRFPRLPGAAGRSWRQGRGACALQMRRQPAPAAPRGPSTGERTRVRPACAPRPQRAPRRWKPRLQRKALLSLAGAVLLVSAGQPVPGEPGPAGGGVSARLSPQAVVVVRLRTSLTCAALGLHL